MNMFIRVFSVLFFFFPWVMVSAESHEAPGRCVIAAAPQHESEGEGTRGPVTRCVFNEDYASTLIKLIESSQESVEMAHYNFNADGLTGKKIVDALAGAAGRGVSTLVFLEGDREGVGEKNRRAASILESRGVRVVLDSKSIVTHAKLAVIDRKFVLSGSTNLTESSMCNNNEVNLLISSARIGKILSDYIRTLAGNSRKQAEEVSKWVRDGKKGRFPRFDYRVNLDSGEGTQESVIALTDEKFAEAALRLIAGARKDIALVTYLFAYPRGYEQSRLGRMFNGLVEAAGRGVKVRIFLENSSLDFNRHVSAINFESAKWLSERCSLEVRFDSPEKLTHAKLMIIDSAEVLAGSTNWHWRDITQAHQVNFLVREAEPVKEMVKYFTVLYNSGIPVSSFEDKKHIFPAPGY